MDKLYVVVLRDAGNNFHFWECLAENDAEAIEAGEKDSPYEYCEVEAVIEAKPVLDEQYRMGTNLLKSYPKLHERVCNMACGEILSDYEDAVKLFDPLTRALMEEGYIDWHEQVSVWQPLEDMSMKDILEQLDNAYSAKQRTVRYILETVQQGIVDDTIDMVIPGDVHEWDMMSFYEQGLNPRHK